jgi:hypothetical protein
VPLASKYGPVPTTISCRRGCSGGRGVTWEGPPSPGRQPAADVSTQLCPGYAPALWATLSPLACRFGFDSTPKLPAPRLHRGSLAAPRAWSYLASARTALYINPLMAPAEHIQPVRPCTRLRFGSP